PEPDMLLLDEPFSAVDQYLRQRLRAQLQGVITGVRQPVLLVTHDLEEARQLADHVGVMIDGQLRRFDSTKAVFNDPGSFEVARVLGWRNLLPVKRLQCRKVIGDWGAVTLNREPPADTAWIGIRSEHLRIAGETADDAQRLQGRLVRSTELGAVRELQFRLPDGSPLFLHRPWNEPVPTPGTTVGISLVPSRLRALPEGRTHLDRVSGDSVWVRIDKGRGVTGSEMMEKLVSD
ncbi:MAG: TOBE domain-containing protein, partial [Gammaproteobacteria bacterium]